jgi:hypothetical protein
MKNCSVTSIAISYFSHPGTPVLQPGASRRQHAMVRFSRHDSMVQAAPPALYTATAPSLLFVAMASMHISLTWALNARSTPSGSHAPRTSCATEHGPQQRTIGAAEADDCAALRAKLALELCYELRVVRHGLGQRTKQRVSAGPLFSCTLSLLGAALVRAAVHDLHDRNAERKRSGTCSDVKNCMCSRRRLLPYGLLSP